MFEMSEWHRTNPVAVAHLKYVRIFFFLNWIEISLKKTKNQDAKYDLNYLGLDLTMVKYYDLKANNNKSIKYLHQ